MKTKSPILHITCHYIQGVNVPVWKLSVNTLFACALYGIIMFMHSVQVGALVTRLRVCSNLCLKFSHPSVFFFSLSFSTVNNNSLLCPNDNSKRISRAITRGDVVHFLCIIRLMVSCNLIIQVIFSLFEVCFVFP